LKTEWLDQRLGANLSVFQQDLSNRAIRDPANGPGESFSVSGGLQRTKGVEVEASGEPLPGLTIGAASTWLWARYIDPMDPNFNLIPELTPSRVSSVFARYDFQKGPLRGFGLGATVFSMGKRWTIQGGQNLFLDGHERVDLHAYYTGIPGVDLSLLVRNVFDPTYIERSNGAYGYGHYFGSPLAAVLRGTIKF
jgi:outer membrane receptor protein involved in Fe transport